MSSGIGGGISGGVATGRGGGRGGDGTHRKNVKKFKGKNLNKLTKAPAAPPVPVISASSGAGSSSSYRGSSSSRNGLLLLSTKSKATSSSSSGGGGGSGLLAPLGAPKTAYDALLLSAGAGGQTGGDAGKKAAPAPAWGIGEKKQSSPSPEKVVVEKSGGEERNEKPDLVLNRRPPLQQQRPLPRRPSVGEVARKFEKVDLDKTDSPKKIIPDRFSDNGPDRFNHSHSGSGSSNGEKSMDKRDNADATQPHEKPAIEAVEKPQERPVIPPKEAPPKKEEIKDEQVEYMSKLAKERAEKRRLEEEARMAAQKERAAMRLRELEAKRLEEKKKQLQIKSQERKEMSKPQVILEPLGKSKKDESNSSYSKPASKAPAAEKNGVRKLYDPDRPYSSLVGGKTTKNVADGSKKQEDRPRGSTKKSPVMGLITLHGKQSMGHSSNETKKEDPPPPVQMVQLSNLDILDRGGRDAGQGGPRMLFDPTSGSMVAVPSRDSREEPKSSSMKKAKQKGSQKSPVKRPDDGGKMSIARRPMDVGSTNESSDIKLLRSKQGKSSRKDDPALQQKNKKLLDSKGRPTAQNQIPRKRIPRTCGVLYKLDKNGNYINTDGCEPENGYGAHRVPGGKMKNPGAHSKLLKQQEVQEPASEPTNNNNTPSAAVEGFSFRNDPGFLQHQNNFEAQQQKILEDAWASLVENEEPEGEGSGEEELEEEEVEEDEEELLASKSGDDEYATALAISPSMMGLNFDTNDDIDSMMLPPPIKTGVNPGAEEPIDLAKFAFEAASSASVSKPANPFSPIGVSGAGMWGAGTSGASASIGGLGALSGWDATPFAANTDTAAASGSAGINGSSSHSSKLHLWGSSAVDAFDDVGLGAFGKDIDMAKGAD